MDLKIIDKDFQQFIDKDFKKTKPGDSKELMDSFSEVFKQSLSDTNQLLNQSDDLQEKFVTGEVEDVHEVMIAAEKAKFALEMTMQIRNLLIGAYKELMSMR
jgi:flagellar hook-basal body complex protein FliE